MKIDISTCIQSFQVSKWNYEKILKVNCIPELMID